MTSFFHTGRIHGRSKRVTGTHYPYKRALYIRAVCTGLYQHYCRCWWCELAIGCSPNPCLGELRLALWIAVSIPPGVPSQAARSLALLSLSGEQPQERAARFPQLLATLLPSTDDNIQLTCQLAISSPIVFLLRPLTDSPLPSW